MCQHPTTTRLPGYQPDGEGNDLILGNCQDCHTTLVTGERQNGEDVYFSPGQMEALRQNWPVNWLERF